MIMWKRIKDNWLQILVGILTVLFGADKAADMGQIPAPGPTPAEYAAEAPSYEVAVSFSMPDGGGPLPAFQDAAKATPADIEAMFASASAELSGLSAEVKYAVVAIAKGAYAGYWIAARKGYEAGLKAAKIS